MARGKVYLVGAGPGKPDLITVRGLNVLQEAQVVIYDYLVDKRLLAVAREGSELICSDKLGKKRYADGFGKAQEKINNLLVKKALAGKKVVRLKNGDPSIFGRLSQEIEALKKHKIEFEIVPGVTAANAVAAYTGIPLTDRRFSSSVVFVTGHEDPNKKESLLDWESIAAQKTIIVYMGVENLSKIVSRLIKAKRSRNTPVVVVSEIAGVRQKIVKGKLKNIAGEAKKAGISPPAIIIIGEVVALERDFNWLKINKRILFTGLSTERFFLSGTYFHLPLIKIEPLKDYGEFDDCLQNISNIDWVVFSGRYGVECFFRRLMGIGLDSRALEGIKIAAVGNSTKRRLFDFGIRADLVPHKESAQGLLERFKKIGLKGQRIFLPRSDLADKGLQRGFEKLGARVFSSIAYCNVMPERLPDIDLRQFDEIMFTSPSTVRNFKKRYKKVPKGVKIRWIGERTKKEVKCVLKI